MIDEKITLEVLKDIAARQGVRGVNIPLEPNGEVIEYLVQKGLVEFAVKYLSGEYGFVKVTAQGHDYIRELESKKVGGALRIVQHIMKSFGSPVLVILASAAILTYFGFKR